MHNEQRLILLLVREVRQVVGYVYQFIQWRFLLTHANKYSKFCIEQLVTKLLKLLNKNLLPITTAASLSASLKPGMKTVTASRALTFQNT